MANKKGKSTKKAKKTTKKVTSNKKVNNSVKRRTSKNSSAISKKVTSVEKKATSVKKKAVQKNTQDKIVQKKIITEEIVKEPEVVFEKEKIVEEKSDIQKTGTIHEKEYSLKESLKEIFDRRFLLFFAGLIVVLIIFFIVLIIRKNNNNVDIKFENISLKKYLNLYVENSGLEYIYITNKDCVGCDSYELSLKKIENEFKIKIKKLDISNLDDNELKELKESNSYIIDLENVPILVTIKDKQSISAINGIKEYSAIRNFVVYSTNPSNKSFNKVSIDKYLSLLKSKDSTLIYICTSSDSVCQKFSTTLEKVSSQKNIKVYYLNTDELETDQSIRKLNESNEIFSKQWFVPAILVVKNGNIKDYRMYSMTEEELINFLDKNKM